MIQTEEQITIKGIRDGLLLSIGEGEFGRLLANLDEDLAARQGFLRGSRVSLAVGERLLDRTDLATLQMILDRHGLALWAVLGEAEATREAARELGLATRLPGSKVDLDGKALAERSQAETQLESGGAAPAATANGLLLRETIRSGRSIYYAGHIVIVGDVNPGAEIIAGGDVVVWGKLRGLVHAGAHGNSGAIICALELIPTQLRIADTIAIPPGERQRQAVPEMASVHGDRIVAEVWQTKK